MLHVQRGYFIECDRCPAVETTPAGDGDEAEEAFLSSGWVAKDGAQLCPLCVGQGILSR